MSDYPDKIICFSFLPAILLILLSVSHITAQPASALLKTKTDALSSARYDIILFFSDSDDPKLNTIVIRSGKDGSDICRLEQVKHLKARDLNQDGLKELLLTQQIKLSDKTLIITSIWSLKQGAKVLFELTGYRSNNPDSLEAGELSIVIHKLKFRQNHFYDYPLLYVKTIRVIARPRECSCDSGRDYRISQRRYHYFDEAYIPCDVE